MFFWSPSSIWVLNMWLFLTTLLLLLKSLNFFRVAGCRCFVKDFGTFSWQTVFSNLTIGRLFLLCLFSSDLFNLVSWVLHQLNDFFQFFLALWSTWINFNNLWLSFALT